MWEMFSVTPDTKRIGFENKLTWGISLTVLGINIRPK